MKLISLQATNRHTNQRQFYKFDLPITQKKVVATSSNALFGYLQFCFAPTTTGEYDIVLTFDVDGQTYRLQKIFDGQTYQTQLHSIFAHSQNLIASGADALAYIGAHFGINLDELLQNCFVTNQTLDVFNGEISAFDQLAPLHQAYNQMTADAPATSNTTFSQQQLQDINTQLASVDEQLFQTNTQLAQVRGQMSQNVVVTEVANQLALLQAEQAKLDANATLVEDMRKQLQQRDEVASIVPKMGELEALSQQKAQYQDEYEQATEKLAWQQAELQSIAEQLASHKSQKEVALDRQNKIDVINQELQTISALHEENAQINLQLVQLDEQKTLLLADKEIFTTKLTSIENEIEQCKQRLEQLNAPEKSVADLLEGVKIETKLEEIASQIEILQTELVLKENQLAQKQSNLVVQVNRFRSVAEMDVSVSPVKAKDTILQVLDAKYNKLEQINKTLEEKLRNLQRAAEDYHYRITQLSGSKAKLQAQLSATSQRKQDEFKREVYLSMQRSLTDITSAYAVTAQLDDAETQQLRQDIDKRSADRDYLVQKASRLEGRIAEIQRHLSINQAEMQSLHVEKSNICDHYNQVVSQNRGEAVFNYLKALESNNGTKYLLDVQQDAVKSQVEIDQLNKSVDDLRGKIQSLQERHTRLVETRSHLANVGENTVSTTQQVKDDLTIVTDELSAHYSLYQSIRQQLDKTETELVQLDGKVNQLTSQLQRNQDQIDKSTQRATDYAGTTNLQQAVIDFKYQVSDAGDEGQMLTEAFSLAQNEVFKRRLQVEKLQWLLQGVSDSYDSLYNQINTQLSQHGLDGQMPNLGAINKHADQMRQTIAKYDGKKAQILAKMAHLQSLVKDSQLPICDDLQTQLQTLVQQQQQLLEVKQQLEQARQMQISALMDGAVAPTTTLSSTDKAVRSLIKQRIDNFLSTAQANLCQFVPNCKLQLVGDIVQVYGNGKLLSYSQMSTTVKMAVYLSLLASSWQGQRGRWLILDEISGVTKAQLTQMLSGTDVQYVVAYTVINKEKQQ